jgi:hypothetical protein
MDEVTKLVISLSARMERLELEWNQTYKNPLNVDKRGNLRRLNNNSPHIMQREPQNRDMNDQKVQTPLQNKLVIDEGGEEEDLDPKIYCLEDTSSCPHLTLLAYKESLMEIQLNKMSKGDKSNNNPNRYNLRSKNKGENPNVPE